MQTIICVCFESKHSQSKEKEIELISVVKKIIWAEVIVDDDLWSSNRPHQSLSSDGKNMLVQMQSQFGFNSYLWKSEREEGERDHPSVR